MIVILMGYMASGKSTIGKILAKKLGFNFMDLDHYIEEKEASSIAEIFNDKGEIYFRKWEALYLNELINKENKIVLSLGGGTPCYGNNMRIMLENKNAVSIYLKASIPNLVFRIQSEKGTRPLISHLETEEALTEFIGKHLFERLQYYNQANVTINTDNKEQNEILEDIIGSLF